MYEDRFDERIIELCKVIRQKSAGSVSILDFSDYVRWVGITLPVSLCILTVYP